MLSEAGEEEEEEGRRKAELKRHEKSSMAGEDRKSPQDAGPEKRAGENRMFD